MNIHEMTQAEIEKRIFGDCHPGALRGFSDVFTDDEILTLADHPLWTSFDEGFKSWAWSAIGAALDRAEAKLRLQETL